MDKTSEIYVGKFEKMATLLRRKLLREGESRFGKVYREVDRKEWGRHSCQMNVETH
jgi:hypothetical protein